MTNERITTGYRLTLSNPSKWRHPQSPVLTGDLPTVRSKAAEFLAEFRKRGAKVRTVKTGEIWRARKYRQTVTVTLDSLTR